MGEKGIGYIERCILVGLATSVQSSDKLDEYLDELEFLVHTAGGKVLKRFTQKLHKPDVRSYVGKGKLEEIIDYVKAAEIDMVVFDDELSPSQQRNIEKEVGVKVLDRTNLILDIFAKPTKIHLSI